MNVREFNKLNIGDLIDDINHQGWGFGVVIKLLTKPAWDQRALIRFSNGRTYHMFLHSPTRRQAVIVAKAKR